MKNNSTEGAILRAQLDINLGKKSTQVKLAWDFKTSELSHVLSLKHTHFWKIKFEQKKHFILHRNGPQNRNRSLVENLFHMQISYLNFL